MIGWIGSAFLLAGAYGVGHKWRPSFIISFIGESLWCIRAYSQSDWALFTICAVFNVMFLRNWWMWRPRDVS